MSIGIVGWRKGDRGMEGRRTSVGGELKALPAMVVACPRCHAKPGDPCTVVRERVWFGKLRRVGEPIQASHAARQRAMGERRGDGGLRGRRLG